MYTLPCQNRSCLLCSSAICLFRENEQTGQNPKIDKQAGESRVYSHVHISLDEVFSKILKKPYILQK